MAEQLGSGSPQRLCPAAPRTVPPGFAPASAPWMPQGVRGAGSGAAAVLWRAGCRLLPSPWVPVVSRGRGDPAEVIGERPTEPSWMPGAGRIRKRWGGRPGRFAPGTLASSPVALPPFLLLDPYFCTVFPSPRHPKQQRWGQILLSASPRCRHLWCYQHSLSPSLSGCREAAGPILYPSPFATPCPPSSINAMLSAMGLDPRGLGLSPGPG